MTREQYLILCRARAAVREQRKICTALERVNEDPKQQYEWDNWQRSEGQLAGLENGLVWLEAFINAGGRKDGP